MAMVQRIKWRRLKRLAEAVVKRPVAIYCSTEMPPSLKAAADIYDTRADIALNLQHIKSAEDALRALSHELAHLIVNTPHHNAEFDAAWAKLYTSLSESYFLKTHQKGGEKMDTN